MRVMPGSTPSGSAPDGAQERASEQSGFRRRELGAMFGLALVERPGRLERGELVSMAGASVEPRPLGVDERRGDIDLVDVRETRALEQLGLGRA